MSAQQHTPGPWSYSMGGDPPYNIGWVSAKGTTVAGLQNPRLGGWDDRSSAEIQACAKANARLIAAAPDLLEACEAFIGVVSESQGINGWHLNGNSADWDEFDFIGAMRAAIAKARGEEVSRG